MLILNHTLINPLNIVKISSKDSINNSLPNDFLIIEGDKLELAKFCFTQNINYSCKVESIKEALLLVNLGVKYLLCKDLEFAKKLQKIAESYLLDAKILYQICNECEIELAAEAGIDGVIFE